MTNDVSMSGSLTKVTKITKRFRFPLLPLLVRGEVGAIPIAPGEVQRQHTAKFIPALRHQWLALRETSP